MVQPSGENISKFIKTDALPPETKTAVERVLKIVDSIHGVDTMPMLFVGVRRGRLLGKYTYKDGILKLIVNPATPDVELTFLHELGHFIDHHGFNPFRESSKSDEFFDEWREAVEKTDSVIALRSAVSRQTSDAVFARYLLELPELWARSYSQFIAVESGDKSLLTQLKMYRNSLIFRERYSQWTDIDFQRLYHATVSLFRAKQWIK
jgi:Zn-dependent peptidase ImmA (M78 family)